MLRLPRVLNGNTIKACTRPAFQHQPKRLLQTTQVKSLQVRPYSFGTSKVLALTAFSGAMATPLMFNKKAVHCEAAFATEPLFEKKLSKPLLNKGELTFGTFLGVCTGFLIKKVGKIFAAFVGTGFVFLQYLAQQGYVTVHWDRMEGGYKNTLGVDKDGRVSTKVLQSKWQKFMNILTSNIQFKSTFLIGFYAGMRYG
ncbi:hypothetical protein INT47_005781 [Mucor saturninus]|uniref:Uncharacterized protein n=1 Tax=Mucor saturninus TaxID=64648 RepID=A0A8H7QKX2_9FUNG|nr:hypothetical protein INT47_005781 [Mucor saturninus]